MILKKLTATRAVNFFATIFDQKNGVSQLARIKDVNDLIDTLNNQSSYRSLQLQVSQDGTNAPTFTKLSVGASECKNNCDCATKECDCPSSCSNESSSAFSYSFARTGAGTYTITINLGVGYEDYGIKSVAAFFAPLDNLDAQVRFVKTSISDTGKTAVYQILTYDSKVLTDSLLVKSDIDFRIYLYKL